MRLTILLVEDDEIENLKFERAFKKLGYNHKVINARNGEEALSLCEFEHPNLILLDLNMPKMNGLEFLSLLKSDENLKHIPAMILTTSNNHNDINNAYKIGVAGYVIKPLRYEAYVTQIKLIIDYWSINELVKR